MSTEADGVKILSFSGRPERRLRNSPHDNDFHKVARTVVPHTYFPVLTKEFMTFSARRNQGNDDLVDLQVEYTGEFFTSANIELELLQTDDPSNGSYDQIGQRFLSGINGKSHIFTGIRREDFGKLRARITGPARGAYIVLN